MVSIFIKGDYRELTREINRLDGLPNAKTKAALNAVLNVGFKATQAQVHVVSGSLKSSGKKSSVEVDDSWVGTITYGGVSLGVNNPVTYAIYEQQREEDHDFFAPLKSLDQLFIKAILNGLGK